MGPSPALVHAHDQLATPGQPSEVKAPQDSRSFLDHTLYTPCRRVTFAASPNQRTTRCAPARGQAALGGGSTAGDFSNRNAWVRLPVSEAKFSTRITGRFSYPPTSSLPARGAGWRAFWSPVFHCFYAVHGTKVPSPTSGRETNPVLKEDARQRSSRDCSSPRHSSALAPESPPRPSQP